MPETTQHINSTNFETLFKEQYQPLFFYAVKFVFRHDIAEELVQDVFVQLWENRKSLQIKTSIKSYLYTAVRNRCLNYLKSHWHRMVEDDAILEGFSAEAQGAVDNESLKKLIQQGIQSLPEKCRIIFTLSRQAGLTYDEIAEELGLSKETVKSQIKIAIQKLRNHLGDRWETLIFIFYQNLF